MTEPRFQVGDLVRVRPFDEIDTDDIGEIQYDAQNRYCYEISDLSIDMHAYSEAPYVIRMAAVYFDSYIYKIGVSKEGPNNPFWWAQGMLRPYEEEEELSDPDPSDLFAFLSSK